MMEFGADRGEVGDGNGRRRKGQKRSITAERM